LSESSGLEIQRCLTTPLFIGYTYLVNRQKNNIKDALKQLLESIINKIHLGANYMHESFRINQYLHTFFFYKLIKFPLFICIFVINFSVLEGKKDISNNAPAKATHSKKTKEANNTIGPWSSPILKFGPKLIRI
jgi:hypothetical protein